MKKIVIVLGVLAVILMVILSAGCTSSSSSTTTTTVTPTPIATTTPTPTVTATPTQNSDTHEYDIVGTWKASEAAKADSNVHNADHYDTFTQDHKVLHDGYISNRMWYYLGDGMYTENVMDDVGTYYLHNGELRTGASTQLVKESGKEGSIIGTWKVDPNNPAYSERASLSLKINEDGSIEGLDEIMGNTVSHPYSWSGSGKNGELNQVYIEFAEHGSFEYGYLIGNDKYLLYMYIELNEPVRYKE